MIPTAEVFFEQGGTYPELAIRFAKLHVIEALKIASEKAMIDTIIEPNDQPSSSFGDSEYHVVNKKSILNAYSLTLIK